MNQPQHISLQSIIAHCNLGAHFIDTGNYRDAIAYLRVGFQAARQELGNKGNEESFGFAQLDHRNNGIQLNIDQHMVKETGMTKHFHCYEEGESSSMFIYKHPIHVPVPTTESAQSLHPKTRLAILSSVLFNLALCHQLEAMRSNVTNYERKLFLTKAVRLYESIFKLVSVGTKEVDGSSYFLMAAMNNTSVAYQSMNQPDVAGMYLSRLVSMMILLVNANRHPSVHQNGYGSSSSSDIECFFRNTFHLFVADGCCAAPAA